MSAEKEMAGKCLSFSYFDLGNFLLLRLILYVSSFVLSGTESCPQRRGRRLNLLEGLLFLYWKNGWWMI